MLDYSNNSWFHNIKSVKSTWLEEAVPYTDQEILLVKYNSI